MVEILQELVSTEVVQKLLVAEEYTGEFLQEP